MIFTSKFKTPCIPVDDSWRKGSAISPSPYAQNALPPSQGRPQPGFGGQGMMQQGGGMQQQQMMQSGRGGGGAPQMPSRPGGGPPGRGPMPPRNALPAPNVPRRPGGPSPQMGGPSMPARPGQGRGPPPLPSRPAGQPINNNNSLLWGKWFFFGKGMGKLWFKIVTSKNNFKEQFKRSTSYEQNKNFKSQ